ncbi:MICOS complex subunit mic25a-like isoform X4 [Cyclopterus lumpus]|uniref:MICOS complex subunit mic25a-like isoform X4 n=1 Tax=Cyclopterus lumpus TaxID=8103 RepID=UPI0014874143|nr:MICOS complex subunit mic25a-like isoform X4 [Cyclopterus lumpus]
MGGNGSAARNVSFGQDEKEKVTVVEGVKLSEEVLRRMRESQGSDSSRPPPRPSVTEVQEEIRKNFERQQALVQEQLDRLAQKEREMGMGAPVGPDQLTPALLMERGKAHEEQERAKILTKQLRRKEKELAGISSFYKEQLGILEKKTSPDGVRVPRAAGRGAGVLQREPAADPALLRPGQTVHDLRPANQAGTRGRRPVRAH